MLAFSTMRACVCSIATDRSAQRSQTVWYYRKSENAPTGKGGCSVVTLCTHCIYTRPQRKNVHNLKKKHKQKKNTEAWTKTKPEAIKNWIFKYLNTLTTACFIMFSDAFSGWHRDRHGAHSFFFISFPFMLCVCVSSAMSWCTFLCKNNKF